MQGFVQLINRGALALEGAEAYAFLDSLVTNAIRPDTACYAALLTPQGRFLHDFFVIPAGPERLYLDCEGPRAADLLQRLSRYKLRRAITLNDMTASYAVVAFTSESPVTLPAAMTFRDTRHPELGQRALVPSSWLPDFKAHLLAAGLKETDLAAYRHRLLELAIPDGSNDMPPERALPLEHNLDLINAVSFSKGCYIGQELTARMNHRDLVKKRLVRVTSAASLPPGGTPVMAGADEAGEMRSSQANLGLAILRLEFRGKPLEAAGATLTATWPDS
jgi:folate-binding protein YgfZ